MTVAVSSLWYTREVMEKPKKSRIPGPRAKKETSWGGVAHWYNKMLEEGGDTYQAQVVLPNLVRLMGVKPGVRVLDLACGQGFFSRAFAAQGGEVTGVDISSDLISFAKKSSPKEIKYIVASAEDLAKLSDASFDVVALVLAIQNIEAPHKVFKECARVLTPKGKLFIVLNHPAFRIPKESSWGYDDMTETQYRRVDRYMSETKTLIDMMPSKPGSVTTVSFHRSLQYYFKTLANAGFAITRLEEWLSHRESEKGPRKAAEDRARKEFPMFLFLEAEVR